MPCLYLYYKEFTRVAFNHTNTIDRRKVQTQDSLNTVPGYTLVLILGSILAIRVHPKNCVRIA